MTKYKTQEGHLLVVNTHLEVFGGKEHRKNQIRQIKKLTAPDSSNTNKVLVGDFNARKKEANQIAKEIGLEIKNTATGHTLTIENTISSAMPYNDIIRRILKLLGLLKIFRMRTDWITTNMLHSKESILYEYKNSDHFPVIVEVKQAH